MINYLLASAFGDALNKIFISIRNTTVDEFKLKYVAAGFAAVFVVFRLIQIVNDIEGDNEAGGLGHVKLWDMIRPIVFYFLVLYTPTIMNMVDSATNVVTESIDKRTDKLMKGKVFSSTTLKEAIDKINKPVTKKTSRIVYVDDEGRQYSRQEYLNSHGQVKAVSETVDVEVKEEPPKELNWWETFTWRVGRFWKKVLAFCTWASVSVITIIYDLIADIMMGLAQIQLTIIVIFAPFVFALSILKPWEKNYQKVIANYVYFQLWRPIIGIISFITTSGISTLKQKGNTAVSSLEGSDLAKVFSSDAASELVSSIASIVLIIIGIGCLIQVPHMANSALNMGSNHDAHAGDAAKSAAKSIPGLNKVM